MTLTSTTTSGLENNGPMSPDPGDICGVNGNVLVIKHMFKIFAMPQLHSGGMANAHPDQKSL